MISIYELVEQINKSRILITGATGLIGKTFIRLVDNASKQLGLNIEIFALVRDEEKAKKLLKDYDVNYIVGDVLDPIDLSGIDYIVHGASVTSSSDFLNKPVETIQTTIFGCNNMLELAKKNGIKSMVFLSSMEVYGCNENGEELKESQTGKFDITDTRSSYCESKILAENLCVSFFKEHSVPVKIVRLAQTLGPGIGYNDGRVFAEFARCVIEEKDIVLNTKGSSKRMYLYSEDAVLGILTILLHGNDGEVYNVADKDSYCSIVEMANMVCTDIAQNRIKLCICIDENKSKKYMKEHFLLLNTEKIISLGWTPQTSLKDAYSNMIEAMKQDHIMKEIQ